MLTDDEKLRIRAEELFRLEVRRDMADPAREKKGVMAFLNSPFGIYLLSTVVVGIISFLYTQHRQISEKEKLREDNASSLQAEIGFRLRQMDIALARAVAAVNELRSDDATAGDAGERILRAAVVVNAVPAVVRVGGLLEIPANPSPVMVRFRDMTIAPDLLPFRQGFQAMAHRYESVVDLSFRLDRLLERRDAAARASELRAALAMLEEPAYRLLDLGHYKMGPAAPADRRLRDPKQAAKEGGQLLASLSAEWRKAKDAAALRQVANQMGY